MSSGGDPLTEPQGQATGGGGVEESYLSPTLTLEPELECFLQTQTTMKDTRDK